MRGKLPVAILWHMHQPCYKHPRTGAVALPWVRLHASRDYLRMARLLREFPAVKANLTVVPSLREQLADYARGAEDDDARIALRAPEGTLTEAERERELTRAVRFNLGWLDSGDAEAEPRLRELAARERGFTGNDLRYVLGRQRALAEAIQPLYQQLERDGQVELVTVPYFHPILPLLIDSASAVRADPGALLPEPPFAFPEDAVAQVADAIAAHSRAFGAAPQGMWPAEGAVSPEAADVMRAAGIAWFASDEGVLARSLGATLARDEIGALTDPALLYRPYRLANGATVLFRDREISDRIAFSYGAMTPHDAVGDFIWKLERARDRLPDDGGPYLALVALDGENAWEGYPNNGNDFLRALYGTLGADERFETVRISEHLAARPSVTELPMLHSGSWIDASYRVWLGEETHARAWGALARTRRFAAERWGSLSATPPAVRRALMVAEGSDWFWWYSSRNASRDDSVFDELFRANLAFVWWSADAEPPPEIATPLADATRARQGGSMLRGSS